MIRAFALACVFAAALFSGVVARAAFIAEVARSLSWQKEADGLNYQTNAPWSARAGWSFYDLDALVEVATLERVDSEAGGEIAYSEQQASLWARKMFAVNFLAKPFVAAGAGARIEETRERFLGQNESSRGKPIWLAGVAGGAVVPLGLGFVAEAEGRLTASPGYAPNPQFSASAALGYRF